MCDSTINNMSQRLGLDKEPKVKSKAEQYLRLLQTKSVIKGVNEYVKAIICLDLSANMAGTIFDMETALTLAGMKKSAYTKQRNLIEKALNLDKILTVPEVCVQLSCITAKDLALDIYKKYKEFNINADFTHPQYTTACVYAACKINKIKVQKSQLVELSHLKSSQWKELEAEFDKFINNAGYLTKAVKRVKKGDFEDLKTKENGTTLDNTKNELIEDVPEDYEVWKNRVLSAAKAALKKNKNF